MGADESSFERDIDRLIGTAFDQTSSEAVLRSELHSREYLDLSTFDTGDYVFIDFSGPNDPPASFLYLRLQGWQDQDEIAAESPVRAVVVTSTLGSLQRSQHVVIRGASLMGVDGGDGEDGRLRKGCSVDIYPLEVMPAAPGVIEAMSDVRRRSEIAMHYIENQIDGRWHYLAVDVDRKIETPLVSRVCQVDPLNTPIQELKWSEVNPFNEK